MTVYELAEILKDPAVDESILYYLGDRTTSVAHQAGAMLLAQAAEIQRLEQLPKETQMNPNNPADLHRWHEGLNCCYYYRVATGQIQATVTRISVSDDVWTAETAGSAVLRFISERHAKLHVESQLQLPLQPQPLKENP